MRKKCAKEPQVGPGSHEQKQAKEGGPPVPNTKKIKDEVSRFHIVADSCIQNMLENSDRMVDRLSKLKLRDLNKQEAQLSDRIQLKRTKSQEKLAIIKNKLIIEEPACQRENLLRRESEKLGGLIE
jgi:hypothetical protein